MFGRRLKKEVDVSIRDADSGAVIDQQWIRTADLPETFAIDTSLEIAGAQYRVVRAQPLLRKDAAEQGLLTLDVVAITDETAVDPGEVLYTLPSLAEPLPTTSKEHVDGSELVLHEDQWRQVEYVSDSQAAVVDELFQQIDQLKAQAQAQAQAEGLPGGFRSLVLRKEPEEPLAGCSLSRSEVLKRVTNGETQLRGLAIRGSPTRVRGGFSAPLGADCSLYGVAAKNGDITVLGIAGVRSRELPRFSGVTIVDWCACERLR